MAAPIRVTFVGDDAGLLAATSRSEAALARFAGSAEEASKVAAKAAADQARAAGLSASEQEAAAARAAAAVVESSARMTEAQKAAARGAIAFAKAQGSAADEQVAAARRAIGAQKELEAQQAVAAKAAKATADKTAAAAEASAARVAASQKKLSSIGKWTLFGGAAGIAASVKGAADLSQSMERLQTQAGASTGQVAKLTQGVLSMAGQVGDSPNQLAQGMYHVVSNLNKTIAPAQRVSSELSALKVAAEGARVGGSDLVDTTNALGGAIRSGIAGTQNYQQAMGALNATVGAGDMSMQNLAEALGTGLLGPMKTYGVSLKDISSALAVFGDSNIKGAEAGTKLNSAIRIMAAPAPAAAKGLAVLHLGVTQLADDIRNKGLPAAIQDFSTHLKEFGGNASQQGDMITRIFGGKQSSGVQVLLNQLGTLKAAEKEVSAGTNQFGSAWQHQQHQLSQEGADLSATIKALADRFGMDLIPMLKTAGTDLGDVIVWFEKNKGAAEALGLTIAGTLGMAVAVFVGTRVVAFVHGLQAMIGGMAKLASGIADGAAAIEAKLSGVSSASSLTAGKVAGSNAAMEASNAEAGASFTALDTEAGAAATGVESKAGAMAAAVTTADGEIEGANAAAAGSFAAISSAAGSLLAKLGPLAIAYAGFQATKATGLFSSGTWGSFGKPSNSFPVPSAHETERSYIAQTLKLPGYNGPLTFAGVQHARTQQGYPAEKSLIEQFFTQMNSEGHFGHHGFVATPGGAYGPGPDAVRQQLGINAPLALPGVSNSATTANPAQMVAFFQKALGLTKSQAAGIAGNVQVESAGTFAGNIVQGGGRSSSLSGSSAAGGKAGYGLGQWTDAGRQANLERLAAQMGLAQDSVKVQEAFIVQELKGSGALKALKGTSTAAQAALVVQNQYEEPLSRTQSLAARQQDAINLAGGAAVTPTGSGASNPASQSLLNYLNGTKTSAGSKATMRYFNHQPVGAMTEAQWQAWQAQNGTAAIEQRGVTGISTTIGAAIQRYQGLQQAATSESVKHMYGRTIGDVRGYGKTFGALAGKATTSDGEKALATQLGKLLTALNQHTQAFVRAVKLDQGYAKAGTSLIGKYGNAAQSGTSRSLENALGFQATGRFLPSGGLGMTGAERLSEPSNMVMLHQLIEGGASPRALGSTVSAMTKGSTQNQAYSTAVQNLIKSGQTKEAEQLVAAHKAAMAALANTLYAEQRTKDGEELSQQATALNDQTSAIQNAMQSAQSIWQASEQKINDMAAGVVQSMQDAQQTINDTMAGVAQSIKDQTAVNTDQSTAVVDAINDQTQTQVDQIGEKGLYGLNLLAQQDKVAADQVKAYWDQQIDAAQKQLDIDQQQANAAENAAQIALDNVTATEHVAVQQAQTRVDTVAIQGATKVAAAQAHADAVQTSVDTTKIGPAQIAVDLNANASKSDQAKYQAQLTAAQGEAAKLTAGSQQNLANVQAGAQSANDVAQNQFDSVNNTATLTIQGATDTLANITNYWNGVIAGAQGTLASTQGNANTAEAGANSTTSVTSAEASTQFSGSGLTINQYGVDLSNPTSMTDATSWAIRASGIATV